MSHKDKKKKEFSHWAASPEDCIEMARRNPGWQFKRARSDNRTKDILDTECFFESDEDDDTTSFYKDD